MKKYIIIVLIVLIILIFISPFLFSLPAFSPYLDFSDKGQIGDTIGGITSPIVGLISILLLYFTLKEQQKFNKSQRKFNKKQVEDRKFDELRYLAHEILTLSSTLNFQYSKYSKYPDAPVTQCSLNNVVELSRLLGHVDMNGIRSGVILKTSQFQLLEGKLFSIFCLCNSFYLSYNIANNEENRIAYLNNMVTIAYGQVCEFYNVFLNKKDYNVILIDCDQTTLRRMTDTARIHYKCSIHDSDSSVFFKEYHVKWEYDPND